uniref:PLA2c domain-containing protein n=1 Tax=Mola mola TaxID=94237 RepID=A0A3Q3VZ16_MOLML
ESNFVLECFQKAKQSLSNCHVSKQDRVPHIALLGSGGGERAAVSLVGSLYQMAEEGLLDTLFYIGGISGSTWAMSSLYGHPDWSTNVESVISELIGPGIKKEDARNWLSERAKDECFSVTDVWAVGIALIMKKLDQGCLSKDVDKDAYNPYPIYCAIERESHWFEMTPHEAGFTELGLFVETSLLGSKFEDGTLLEKKPEMDMIKLQVNREVSKFALYLADDSVPRFLQSKEEIYLIDAGLMMNVPYPPFLGEKRGINLIIAPEFSAGKMFETLTLARDYAAKVGKPFPKIDDKIIEKDRDFPKDCYVFEGKGKEPTIIYMPLFNRRNCKGLRLFFWPSSMDEFSTFQRAYNNKKINILLEMAKDNIKMNKKTLLEEIEKAANKAAKVSQRRS